MKHIKYLITTVSLMILSCCSFSFVSYPTTLSPSTTFSYMEQEQTFLGNTQQYLEQKEYEKAFYSLMQHKDQLPYLFQNQLYEATLEKCKQQVLITANAYLHNQQPQQAYTLLSQYLPYFTHDAMMQQLYDDAKYQTEKMQWQLYTGHIHHLSLKCLISNPTLALNSNNPYANTFFENHLTPYEFNHILMSLYDNNYILVDIYECFSVVNNTVERKDLYIPEHKKPLLLTIEDVSYSKEQKNKGMVDRLLLDRKKQLATYTTKKSIQDRVSYEDEFAPLLESFMQSHPDFSHNGARAILGLTGENGILGYRTQKTNANSRYDIKKALEVVTKLKNLGYHFASMGYSHTSITTMSELERNKDLYLWQEEVSKIVGKTPIYLLPNEKTPIPSEVKQSLTQYGYTFLIGNYGQDDTLCPRIFIGGKQLVDQAPYLAEYFDCTKVYDSTARDQQNASLPSSFYTSAYYKSHVTTVA